MKNVVCYFSNWASHREGAGKFVPENVDASKCSHVFYAFASLDGEKMEIVPQVHLFVLKKVSAFEVAVRVKL